MKLFIVLSALVAIASAGYAGYAGHHYAAPVVHHAPAIVKHHTVVEPVVRHSSHVVQEPALFQKTIAVPASIPAVIPRVSHSTATVPEHRFSRQDWIQPGPIFQTPAVRQHTIHRQIPVQYESVRSIPTVSYSTHTRPVAIKTAVAVPASIQPPSMLMDIIMLPQLIMVHTVTELDMVLVDLVSPMEVSPTVVMDMVMDIIK